mgnify:CR=1 FL=1
MGFLIQKNVERLLRFDIIRVLKLAEIIQYAIMAFVFGFVISLIINKLSNKLDKKKKHGHTIFEVILHMALLIIVAYYINKLIRIFPFIGAGLSNKYIPSKKNEATIGVAIGLSYIYTQSQINLGDKVKHLTNNLL